MKNIKIYITILIILSITSLLIYYVKWEYRGKLFEINFLSLNRGRGIFIRTPMNKTILIGGGQSSQIIKEITNLTPFYNRVIDYVIIPSSNKNQIGALIDIINRYEIGEIIISKDIATSTVLDVVNREIIRNKIGIKKVEFNEIIKIENNFDIKVIFPYPNFKFNKTSLPELGLQINYLNTSLYLIGNLSKAIQKYIAKNIDNSPRSGVEQSIIEFYNSASESKVSKELLNKIKPKFTFTTKEKTMHLISDGNIWLVK